MWLLLFQTALLAACAPTNSMDVGTFATNVAATVEVAMAQAQEQSVLATAEAGGLLPAPAIGTPAKNTTDTTVPLIQAVNASTNKIWYEEVDCGPISTIITANVLDKGNNLDRVELTYRYNGWSAGNGTDWITLAMAPDVGGNWTATINAQLEGQALHGVDGVVEYQVQAIDTAGNFNVFPDGSVYGVEINACQQAEGPTQQSANSNGTNPQTVTPTIHYFTGTSLASPGQQVYVEWSVSDAACGVFFQGGAVDPSDSWAINLPMNMDTGTHTYKLEAWGLPCENPSVVTKTWKMTVEDIVASAGDAQPIIAKGGGNLFPGQGVDLTGAGVTPQFIFDVIEDQPYFAQANVSGTNMIAWGSIKPSFENCLNTPTYGNQNIGDNDYFCFLTYSGQPSIVTIHNLYYDLNNNSWLVEISYETWVNP
jgi:hypothetical protein